MQPIRLYLKNFCAHTETEFSFEDFSSALIVGKVKDNERFSNGAGKSTIFNAIEYVLFNEVHFSSLEKTIRDGCDVCRVEFDFISSLDKGLYRIIRSNSRKSGTDARLFKLIKDNQWEDLTQRRVSDTEKEIIKVVGFTYKTFCASVLFSQSGSENNIQKDYGNLPALTPEKRKTVLREVLQLNVYANYEKLAKAKYGTTLSELDKQRVLLETLDGVDDKLNQTNTDRDITAQKLKDHQLELDIEETKLAQMNADYTLLFNQSVNYSNDFNSLKSKERYYIEQVSKSRNSILEFKAKIASLPQEAEALKMQVVGLNQQLLVACAQIIDVNDLKLSLDKVINTIITNRSNFNSVVSQINECHKPFTEEKYCAHCHQAVSDEHKYFWSRQMVEKLSQLEEVRSSLAIEGAILLSSKKDMEQQISLANENAKRISSIEYTIASTNKDIEAKRSLYSHYSSLLLEHEHTYNIRSQELEQIRVDLHQCSGDEHLNITSKLNLLKENLVQNRAHVFNLLEVKNTLSSKLAVINHQIEDYSLSKQKVVGIKCYIMELEKSLLLYSKVAQAFGSNGIPALITHSILDELQEEANKWLLKLRPGLQLQFIIVNDKNNKDKEDTLDILYFIDGNQREYKQLSGAQKIIVSLSIKLALLFIMNKRLGIDIKFILFDEIDSSLDLAGTEIFADIIKIIQDEFKILIITHNEMLRCKFSHTILVEQDENNTSKGKLVNW